MIPILCTLFDRNYLTKGVALIRSLQARQSDFRLFVLALDGETGRALDALNDARLCVLPLEALKTDALRRALSDRDEAEWAWTLTPVWTRHVLNYYTETFVSDLPGITYLDADSYLFQPLDEAYREIENSRASVAITPHRFPPDAKWRERENGIYNVNFVYLKNDSVGRRAADEWAAQCLAWCYRRTERAADGALLFGDQGYLDAWTVRYGAHAVKHLGVNLAPWNQAQYDYTLDGGRLFVIERDAQNPLRVTRIDPLILYHFHEHRQMAGGWTRGNYTLTHELTEYVYGHYEHELNGIERERTSAQRGLAHARGRASAARARDAAVSGGA